ncbi:hypothetical protein [Paraburkholderia rhizosphaerae]|uniref:Uncharacterized protein n=1 Tax=Paraburkholderia rhizosphaerae TaxID=480658 RepID=A0A4R8LPK9_9BURK|nr:hypothetical protein [Paraburkholderia rhizosphaerae]TDY48248.1 hypothetical protein BX592_111183 [Paraburkholderia rhizosphaerae]
MAINVPTPPARATAAARGEWIGYAARLRSLLACVPPNSPEVRQSIELQLDVTEGVIERLSAHQEDTAADDARVFEHG